MSRKPFLFAVLALVLAAAALYAAIRIAIWAIGFLLAGFALLVVVALVLRAQARRRG